MQASTLWWFLAKLGTQLAALQVGRQMILERDPKSTIHRFLAAVAPRKFRSPQRELVLRQARELFHLIDEWESVFQQPFFPRFATRSGFD